MERMEHEATAVHYPYLRGLLAVPLGVLFILSGLGNIAWGPFAHSWVVIVAGVLAVAAYPVTALYYVKTYGRVVPKRNTSTFIGANVLCVVVAVGGPILIDVLNLPINGFAVSWAATVLVAYAVTIGLRTSHSLIWGTVLLLGLIPVWGDPATTDSSNIGLVILGVAAIATGILDHRVLVRMFDSFEPGDEVSHAAA
jgi:hypothetical protein